MANREAAGLEDDESTQEVLADVEQEVAKHSGSGWPIGMLICLAAVGVALGLELYNYLFNAG